MKIPQNVKDISSHFMVSKIFLSVYVQSCPTLRGPMDCSPLGSPIHEILQARILERVTISFFRGFCQHRDQNLASWISCIGRWFFTTSAACGKQLWEELKCSECLLCTWYWAMPFFICSHSSQEFCASRNVEKAMAPHSSTLAWKIPWTEELGRLQSMGSWRVEHDWASSLSLFTFMHWGRKWQPTPVFLPGESQGWGRTESDTTEVT